jgi:hypothetical protein
MRPDFGIEASSHLDEPGSPASVESLNAFDDPVKLVAGAGFEPATFGL